MKVKYIIEWFSIIIINNMFFLTTLKHILKPKFIIIHTIHVHQLCDCPRMHVSIIDVDPVPSSGLDCKTIRILCGLIEKTSDT